MLVKSWWNGNRSLAKWRWVAGERTAPRRRTPRARISSAARLCDITVTPAAAGAAAAAGCGLTCLENIVALLAHPSPLRLPGLRALIAR